MSSLKSDLILQTFLHFQTRHLIYAGVLKSHHEEFLAQLHIAHSNISVTPVHQPLPDTPPPSEHSSTTSFEIDQDADVGVISWVISAPLPGSAPDADDADVPVGERTGLRKRQAGETETEDAGTLTTSRWGYCFVVLTHYATLHYLLTPSNRIRIPRTPPSPGLCRIL